MTLNRITKNSCKLSLLIIVLSVNCYCINAQYLYDFGVGGGLSGYTGEVSHSPFSSPGYTFGAFFRSNLNSRMAVRLDFGYGEVGGHTDDVLETYPSAQGICKFDFLTRVISTDLLLDINFFPYPFQKTVPNSSNITPYSFIGMGMEAYKPIGGVDVENGTEVLGTTLSIPFGVGVKWMLNDHWGFQVQFKAVKMFIDDFDSYQLDDPFELGAGGWHRQDWYYTSTVMLIYSFGEDIWDCNCPGSYKRRRSR